MVQHSLTTKILLITFGVFFSIQPISLNAQVTEDSCLKEVEQKGVLNISNDCFKLEKVKALIAFYCTNKAKLPEISRCQEIDKIIQNQPSTQDPSVTVTPQKTTVGPCIGADCTYELLEPLPGLEKVEQSMDVGKWVNTMVRVIIGIIGVLAVVMIVVGGIQYMTTDAIGKKESGKETVQGALFGVVLALAAYIILRTINPQLVSLDLAPGTANTAGVEVDLPEELRLEYEREDSDLVGGQTSLCKGGLVAIDTVNQKNILVCKDIAENFKNLIAAAKKEGIILTASGGRTNERQIELRKQNCGTSDYDINQKPSNQCKPPTARPGKSRHQMGLAFDFKNMCYPRKSSTCTTPGFKWLQANAKKYGLYNLPSEAWHWSTDGH